MYQVPHSPKVVGSAETEPVAVSEERGARGRRVVRERVAHSAAHACPPTGVIHTRHVTRSHLSPNLN